MFYMIIIFIAIIAALFLNVIAMIAGGHGFLPHWLVEILLSLFWFTYVFRMVNQRFFDITRPRSSLAEHKDFVGSCIMGHIVLAYLLSFILLPVFGVSGFARILAAYGGSFFLALYLPLLVADYYLPYKEKQMETERVNPEELKVAALQDERARKFIQTYPEAQAYVFNHVKKNERGVCVFLYRRPRTELANLWEDITLEVPVHMDTLEPAREKVVLARYLHHTEDGQTAVLNLPAEHDLLESNPTGSLSEETISQLDYQPYRYQSLEAAPFIVVNQKAPYEVV